MDRNGVRTELEKFGVARNIHRGEDVHGDTES
jgi:hypothetical protein